MCVLSGGALCNIPQIPERQREEKRTDSHSIQRFNNRSPNSESLGKEVTEKKDENRAVPIQRKQS